MSLTFRPHHFLCALGYQGKGYSDSFTANMNAIVLDTLRVAGGDDTEITVTLASDTICAPCPKRRDTQCEVDAIISALDTAHAAVLHLRAGDTLTWGEAKSRMTRLPDDIHDHICAGCQWKSLGLCQSALMELKTEARSFCGS